MSGMEKLGGDSHVDTSGMLTWILEPGFQTSEEAVRRVFGGWLGDQPEGVEFTDANGDRQTIVVYPPETGDAS